LLLSKVSWKRWEKEKGFENHVGNRSETPVSISVVETTPYTGKVLYQEKGDKEKKTFKR